MPGVVHTARRGGRSALEAWRPRRRSSPRRGVTSRGTNRARSPSESATARPSSTRTSPSTTAAPRSTKSRASASPWPRAPPADRARPARRGGCGRRARRAHSTATGFTGQPVPPGTRSGATVRRNSQRPSSAQARRQVVEAQVVDEHEPEAGDPDLVDREGPLVDAEAGHRIGDPVAAEQGDAPLVQPREALGGEPGHAVADGVEPAALLGPSPVPTGRDDQEVALADGHPRRGLGRLELVGADGRVARQVRHPEGPGDVEQHAPTDDPVGHGHDRVRGRARGRDGLGGAAVVGPSPDEHVAQRVDVGDPEAVHVGADVVAGRLVAGDAVGVEGVPAGQHVVVGREGVLRRGHRRDVVGEAHHPPGAHARTPPRPAARA